MPKDNISIYNHSTGESLVREMTNEEQAEREAQIEAHKIEKAKRESDALQLREAKLSAYQKLGLTQTEIEALLPIPNLIKR